MTKTIWESFRAPQEIRLARNSGNLETLKKLQIKYQDLVESEGSQYNRGCLAVLTHTIEAMRQVARFNSGVLPDSQYQASKGKVLRAGSVARWGDKRIKAAARKLERIWLAFEGMEEADQSLSKANRETQLEALALTMSTSDQGRIILKEFKKLYQELQPSVDQCRAKILATSDRTNPGRGSQGYPPKFPGLPEVLKRYEAWQGLLETAKRYA